MTVTDSALVPGMLMQPKSTPTCLLLARQTPFIQSPWICISAVPLITVLVVSFQARLTQPSSVCAEDLAERLDRLLHRGLIEHGLVGRAGVEAIVDVRAGDRGEQRVERVAGLEGVAADGDEGVAGVVDLLLVGPHVVERCPLGRIDARRLGDLLVVVDHAVDVHGDRDLEHLAVDGDRVEHRLREGLGGADLVEEGPTSWACPFASRSRKKLEFRRDEERSAACRRRTG